MPTTWGEGTYWLAMRLLGVIPFGRQAIVISYPSDRPFTLRDNGYSHLIKRWDHVITISRSGQGTLYRDQLTIEAGLLTSFIWFFAQLFYRHRQRRWRQLAALSFDYARS